MIVGQRPMHSMKLLVRTASMRSRGESIMRHAITPAALQPKPMPMLMACFPCAPAQRNKRSRLNATRGR